jgi:hypothetical protein
MKTIVWIGLLVAAALPLNFTNAQDSAQGAAPSMTATTATALTNISPAVAEVIRLAESGVGDDVVLAYIQNSQATFDLRADDVLYLRDVGVSSAVITAMLTHDTTLRNQIPANANTVPPEPVPEPTPPPTQELPPVYSSTAPAEVNYFYNDLSPYGTWVDLAGVGWCWQPRLVLINHEWRPYCDGGHWVYSDCGWYWQSDYSWGWAPFHYGRWQLHNRCGWVWTPDTVWAPAWVTWRTSGDYCGWAPLPPHAVFDAGFGWRFNGARVGLDFDFGLRADSFTFVAFHDFTHHDLGHRHLAGTEVARAFNRATVINNFAVNNRLVVNRGIPVDRVSTATRSQIRTVAIRDSSASAGRGTGIRGMENGTPVLYRPQLRKPSNQINVVAQKVDQRHSLIQHSTIMAVRNAPARTEMTPRLSLGSSLPMPGSEIERRSSGPNQSVPRSELERRSSGGQSVPRSYQQTPIAPNGPARTREDSVPRSDAHGRDTLRITRSQQSNFGARDVGKDVDNGAPHRISM